MASGKANHENRKRGPSASSVSPLKKTSPSKAARAGAAKKRRSNQEKNMADEKDMTEGAEIPPQAESKMQSGASHVRQAAEDLRSAAGSVADEYRGRAEEVWNDASNRVRSFQEDTEQYVRENPTKAVFTALGVGFVLGLIFRR
jgi:ElaB/YqjD/DUF883 family membrane-anchored ribosome-binding protein